MSAADFARRSSSASGIAENIGMARTSSVVNIVRLALPSVERCCGGNRAEKSRASRIDDRDCGRDQGRSYRRQRVAERPNVDQDAGRGGTITKITGGCNLDSAGQRTRDRPRTTFPRELLMWLSKVSAAIDSRFSRSE